MRVAGITARGEPVEILEVDELAPPAADEVLLDVAAAGIGNWDELVRIGSWQLGGPAPMALGTEAAGTVVAAGSRVAEVRDGDEVMTHPLPLRRHGTWAGKVLAPAATVAPRPRAASWEASGAFPIPALTAAQALDEALGIESGGWVVVNGAGGVTGGLLVQLAAARGARVIATASAKKAERIRDYGASEVLDYHGDWPALVREITGGGAPKAVNAAPGQAATTLKAVADGGRLATITGDPPGEERGVAWGTKSLSFASTGLFDSAVLPVAWALRDLGRSCVLWSFAYLGFCRLLELLVLLCRSAPNKELEIL